MQFPQPGEPKFHYKVFFTPAFDLLLPYSLRDIMPLFKGNGRTQNTSGTIHASQVGLRSGLLFFTLEYPQSGSVFYFQNLTELNAFCEATGTVEAGNSTKERNHLKPILSAKNERAEYILNGSSLVKVMW